MGNAVENWSGATNFMEQEAQDLNNYDSDTDSE